MYIKNITLKAKSNHYSYRVTNQ